MQQNFTQKKFKDFFVKTITLILFFSAITQISFAQQFPANVNKLTSAEKAKQRVQTLQSGLKGNAALSNDAGIISKVSEEINSPQAICTTWNVSITSADPTTTQRAFRDGVPKTCAAPGTCTPGLGGSFNYQILQWTNPVAQCVTVTYTATNSSFGFVSVHNAPPTLGNTCANWVADPGSSSTLGVPIVFSFNGTAGTTYYFFVTNVGAPPSNCTIQIDAPVCFAAPCSGSPNPGNTTGPAAVCPTVPFTVGIQNPQNFAGIAYQWQSGPSASGPWANISGATSSTYTTSITTATAYRCNVTCTNSSITVPSNGTLVNINPPSMCYCAAGATDMIDEKISRVRYNTIDNSSTSQAGYEDFTSISTNLIQGSTQDITVNISNFFTGDLVRVWIDFNQNGNFTDPGERVVATTNTVNPAVASITIPLTASLGSTRMRVRMYWQPSDPDPGPCGNTVYGQVEDYTVNIQPCIQGVFNTQPANTSIQCGGTATFSFTATGSLLVYGWEYRVTPTSPWLVVTNGGVYSGATTNTLAITNAPQTMNGYQYRATMQGTCTAIDFTNVATLSVTPYIVNVVPPSATICTGTIQPLTITNTISSPTTSVFSSGAISIPIPDANVAGINHTIPVSGISGLITDISVRFSIPAHTWPGDLVVALRGPSGQILNLDYFISNTGAGPGAGMVNTNMSSNGTAVLSSATAPYTGTFRPDAQMTATINGPIGPTGFQTPAVANYGGLVNFSNGSTANGNWTIAIYDGFGGDIGSLTNWQVSITYTAPVFAQGVWSGPAGTMWNTPAGPPLNPYVQGTLQTTIYVNPTANANYSVVVTTATPCVSPATIVPVNVTNPITGLTTPADRTVCVGGNTSFSVSPGGGPLTYQWQVSVNSGLTWTNIAGATSATLNLTNVTQLMNNNQYRVIVTAAPCGSLTTLAGKLTVNLLPVVTISATSLQLVPGTTSTISGTSTPAPNATLANWVWTLNGNTIAGATSSSVTANVDQTGAYQASVTDINGCRNSSNIVTIVNGVSDRLWIIPNPNTGNFQVRLYYSGSQSERRIVRIYNTQGQLMAQQSYDFDTNTPAYYSMNFSIPGLAAGTYAVKVVNSNEKKITSGLMVIQ
jgi:subtilisin-like proprotein convertase family protein